MNKYNSYIFCLIAIFIFSTHEVLGKIIDSSITPIAITIYRFFIGSFLLSLYLFFNKKKYLPTPNIKYILIISAIGALNVCISMYSLQLAVFYGQASIAAILIGSNSLFVSIFALFILREKLYLKNFICMILGLLGLLLILYSELITSTDSNSSFLGILFALIASVTFALYTVLSKQQIVKSNSLYFNAVSFFSGALVLLIIGLISGQDLSLSSNILNNLSVLYLGIFVTCIGYVLFFTGLSKIRTSVGSSFFLLKPVFASILAYVILHETLTITQMIGILVVIISIFIIHNNSQ